MHEIRASRERLCLLIESESDIQTNEQSTSISSPHQPIMTWLSRSKSKINAEVLTMPSQELIEIYKNRYGIGFKKPIMYMVKNLHKLDIFQPNWLKLGMESLNGRTQHMHTIYLNQPTTQPPY